VHTTIHEGLACLLIEQLWDVVVFKEPFVWALPKVHIDP
jgi:hypothetical protein